MRVNLKHCKSYCWQMNVTYEPETTKPRLTCIVLRCCFACLASANSPCQMHPKCFLGALSCAQKHSRNLSSIHRAWMPLGSHQGAPTSVTICLQDAFPEAPRGPGQGSRSGLAGPRRVCDYVNPKRTTAWGASELLFGNINIHVRSAERTTVWGFVARAT